MSSDVNKQAGWAQLELLQPCRGPTSSIAGSLCCTKGSYDFKNMSRRQR